ncbi:U20-like protein [Lissonota sp. PSUC_FEM 10030012]|nr:U20-like protein [Lissonota sp. PSUC_FEM 10030012]
MNYLPVGSGLLATGAAAWSCYEIFKLEPDGEKLPKGSNSDFADKKKIYEDKVKKVKLASNLGMAAATVNAAVNVYSVVQSNMDDEAAGN